MGRWGEIRNIRYQAPRNQLIRAFGADKVRRGKQGKKSSQVDILQETFWRDGRSTTLQVI